MNALARVADLAVDDGARLAVFRLRGPSGAPPLVWGHANGFCAESYPALLSDLARDHDVWAWDARGHGESALARDAEAFATVSLARVADDAAAVCAVVEAETGRRPAVAGHSFGALCLLHAARAAAPWRAGCFFEPPIPSSDAIGDPIRGGSLAQRIHATLRRRRRWSDPTEFAARLRRDAGHALINDAALLAHARAALRPDADGWSLRCSPEVEAAVYRLTFSSEAHDALRRLDSPTLFVCSTTPPKGLPASAQAIVARACGGEAIVVPNTTHFLPLERPDACAQAIRAAVAASDRALRAAASADDRRPGPPDAMPGRAQETWCRE